MPPSDLAHTIEHALADVRDQRSFVQRLLIDALGWPIDESAAEVNDIAYCWSQEELRASGLEKPLVDGRIWQIQPLAAEQPWGVFLLEFTRPDAFETGRGMVGPLRKVLRGLVPSWRKGPAAKTWNREHLLFFCTHKYEHYRVGYFKSPPNKTTAAPLAAFGWGHGIPARTACEFNLPALAWPDDLSPDVWVARWASAFDVEKVTKEFYQELANWYFWALGKVRFPKDAPRDAEDRDALSLIRLITRLIFCWFIKEKGLIPSALFDPQTAPALLADAAPKKSTYYQAILQNLFFATLNQEMGKREFRKEGQNFMAHNLYRYRRLLKNPEHVLKLFDTIPFMNGGLFECLDKQLGTKERPRYLRIDGFSDRDDNELSIPNELFFSGEQTVDLSHDYGEARYRTARVRGLIHTLTRYKFTLAENTPLEQEVALDPELLGKVFENLLASCNPETGATARKATGSFYTPRQIVDYMVDESLVASFKSKLEAAFPEAGDVEQRLRHLLAYNDDPHQLGPAEVDALIHIVDHVKILDPACGSGAFPMGVLHKLVFVLAKLDPGNERWKARQVAKAEELTDATVREKALADIEEAFAANYLDYGRKLYLIENCIYGVDIQPIAVQISKLRCFISLIVDQKKSEAGENLGIRPLPNLETNFVAANSLVGIDRPRQKTLRNRQVDAKELELRRVRDRHFSARTPATKAKCREEDARLRGEIAELLEDDGWGHATARQLASWDPYDQNASAEFFDAEWMFGIPVGKVRVPGKGKRTLAGRFSFVNELPGQMELVEAGEVDSGFDVVVGNPPYLNVELLASEDKAYFAAHYETFYKRYDVFGLFFEASLLRFMSRGVVAFIVPSQVFNNLSYKKLRELILSNRWLSEVLYLGDKIFEAANNDTCVLFLNKNGSLRIRLVNALDFERRATTEVAADYFAKFGGVISVTGDSNSDALTEKVFSPKHDQIQTNFEVFQGIVTGNNDAFILEPEQARKAHIEKSLLHPVLHGRDFEKWYIRNVERMIVYTDANTDIKKYENAQKWLLPHRAELARRRECKRGIIPWWSLQWPRDKALLDTVPKIAVQATRNPRLPVRIVATLDTVGVYGTQGLNFIIARGTDLSVEYLIAILNSQLINYVFRTKFLNVAIKAEYLKRLRVPTIPRTEQRPFANLTRQILAAKQLGSDTLALEEEIDRRVNELYEITPEEAAVVRGGTGERHRHGARGAPPPFE